MGAGLALVVFGYTPSPAPVAASANSTSIPVWDTAWDMPTRATLEEVDEYFDHLAAAGFHGVWISYFNQWSLEGVNRYGDTPARLDDDGQIILNSSHSALMVDILDRAESRGLAIGMVAMWANSYVNDFEGDDCTPNAGVLKADNSHRLGRQLGESVGQHPALEMWVFGGDNWCDQSLAADVDIWRHLAAGLDEAGATQTTTYHTAGWQAAHRKFMDEDWLDVLSPQTTHCDPADVTVPLLADLMARQPKPVLAAEMRYEAIEPSWCQEGSYGPGDPVPPEAILEDARAALAAGVSAYVYGHNERWLWGGGTLGSKGEGWPSVKESFTAEGERLMLDFFRTGEATTPPDSTTPLTTSTISPATTQIDPIVTPPTTVAAPTPQTTTPPTTTTVVVAQDEQVPEKAPTPPTVTVDRQVSSPDDSADTLTRRGGHRSPRSPQPKRKGHRLRSQ